MPGPATLSVGGIIIDDIVWPTGETHMAVLGGGVTHAAAGMAIWDQRPGLLAYAGQDLPDALRQRLERDFDLQGLIMLDQPQARAWQIFEWDGRRTEIFRVDDLAPFLHGPEPDDVPDVYRQSVKGLHLLRDGANLSGWRAVFPGAMLLWEPIQQYMVADNAAAFRAGLPLVDIVSPNYLEARAVYGLTAPDDLVWAMLDDGAQVAALRMGEQGSLVGKAGGLVQVPPVPVPTIVDQTGAGNTYCGGFLVGWLESGSVSTAAAYGAVAASFALETIGVANPPPNMAEIREQRYRWVSSHLSERFR